MAIPSYIPILKAKKAEFEALSHLPKFSSDKFIPFFEIPRITGNIQNAKRFKDSTHLTQDYLNEIIEGIVENRSGQDVFIDIFRWAPNANIESGEHVLNYAYRRLMSQGVSVNPVIGYDRWDDMEYQRSLCEIEVSPDQYYCIRLDTFAIEDVIDTEFFNERIDDILDTLSISPAECSILIDFGDVTNIPIGEIQYKLENVITVILPRGFKYISLTGCSMAKSIDLAVKDTDSEGMVDRREMIAWQATRLENPDIPLVFSDYCIRNPSSMDEVIAPHANGKIRYTINKKYFVVRGHSLQLGNKGAQHYRLAQKLIDSGYYQGQTFSWGDQRIMSCSKEEFKGNPANWIAIDTNHHIKAVLAEIYEFNRTIKPTIKVGETSKEVIYE